MPWSDMAKDITYWNFSVSVSANLYFHTLNSSITGYLTSIPKVVRRSLEMLIIPILKSSLLVGASEYIYLECCLQLPCRCWILCKDFTATSHNCLFQLLSIELVGHKIHWKLPECPSNQFIAPRTWWHYALSCLIRLFCWGLWMHAIWPRRVKQANYYSMTSSVRPCHVNTPNIVMEALPTSTVPT